MDQVLACMAHSSSATLITAVCGELESTAWQLPAEASTDLHVCSMRLTATWAQKVAQEQMSLQPVEVCQVRPAECLHGSCLRERNLNP